jgi:hypothetical protein
MRKYDNNQQTIAQLSLHRCRQIKNGKDIKCESYLYFFPFFLQIFFFIFITAAHRAPDGDADDDDGTPERSYWCSPMR